MMRIDFVSAFEIAMALLCELKRVAVGQARKEWRILGDCAILAALVVAFLVALVLASGVRS